MKNLLILLCFLLSSCISNDYVVYRDPDPAYIRTQAHVEHLLHSTVALVKGEDERDLGSPEVLDTLGADNSAYCSGVFISRNQVLTAHHCIARRQVVQSMFGEMTMPTEESPVGDSKKVAVMSFYSEGELFRNYRLFTVSKIFEQNDLALLELSAGQNPDFYREVADISPSRDMLRGERTFVIGHPGGLAFTLTDGIVSKPIITINDGKYVQCSTPIYFGNSGGPVFDNKGSLVGIVSMLYEVPHLGFSVHLSAIRTFALGNQNATR